MSAANRGAVRDPDDFYVTPAWTTRSILRAIAPRLSPEWCAPILEPSAGNGAIVDELRAFGFPSECVEAIEIDPKRADASGAKCADFLTVEPDPRFELVITNPPFSLALQFAKHAIQFLRPGGTLALLTRINWLASEERSEWMRDNTPSVYVLPKRPPFAASVKCVGVPTSKLLSGCGYRETLAIDAPRPKRCPKCGDGKIRTTTTDATEYAWMIWRPQVCVCFRAFGCSCFGARKHAAPARVHILPMPDPLDRFAEVTL
jgi:hypothetical protein